MLFRQQGSLVPGFHTYAGRYQIRKKQVKGYQRSQTTHRCQNHSIFRRFVQFLPDTYQEFRHRSSTSVQAYTQGFRLQRRNMPKEAMSAFSALQNALTSDPIMAFPRADRQYALITDAATGTADTPGGLGAILTQKDKFDNYYAISYASRQLKDHEKNYSPFLLESAAAVWGMDVFNEYLKGKQFILFTDQKPLEKMGHLHTKTMNRLQAALLEHDFVIQYKKVKLCRQTTYPDSQLLTTIKSMKSRKVSIPFNQTSTIYKKPMTNCKT